MKPGYWIGILALLGAVLGYLVFRATGWLDPTVGVIAGIIIGAIIATRWQPRTPSGQR